MDLRRKKKISKRVFWAHVDRRGPILDYYRGFRIKRKKTVFHFKPVCDQTKIAKNNPKKTVKSAIFYAGITVA